MKFCPTTLILIVRARKYSKLLIICSIYSWSKQSLSFLAAILWFWDSLILKCRSVHLLFYWILFENVMSLHRTKATFIGLLEAGRANEWVVTEKLGDALKNKSNSKAPKRPLFRIGDRWECLKCLSRIVFDSCFLFSFYKRHSKLVWQTVFDYFCRINLVELGFGAFLFFCGCYDFLYGKHNYFIYLFLQTLTFTIVGFGYIGTIVPGS